MSICKKCGIERPEADYRKREGLYTEKVCKHCKNERARQLRPQRRLKERRDRLQKVKTPVLSVRTMTEEVWGILAGSYTKMRRYMHLLAYQSGFYVTPKEGEDLLQDALFSMLVAARQPPALEEQVLAWAYHILHNKVKNYAQKLQREQKELVRYFAERRAEEQEEDMEDIVLQAMAKLSPRQEEVARLRWAGMDYKQLAVAMGISMGAVKFTLHMAVKNLKKLLANRE